MHFVIESAVILTVLGDVDHAFIRAIERRVKDPLLFRRAAFDLNLAENSPSPVMFSLPEMLLPSLERSPARRFASKTTGLPEGKVKRKYPQRPVGANSVWINELSKREE